jgi:prenyltransferase beta subunit
MSATVPVAGVQSLIHAALPNGGWEWSPGWNGDTNTTALAIQALVAAGEPVSSTAIISGLAFLKSAQNGDGGFAYDPVSPFGRDSDANSTAYVAQALAAAGEDPTGPAWTISDANPIGYLLNLQLADGSFEWQKGAGVNELSTQQAVSALLRAPYPVRVGVEACYDIYLPMIGR